MRGITFAVLFLAMIHMQKNDEPITVKQRSQLRRATICLLAIALTCGVLGV